MERSASATAVHYLIRAILLSGFAFYIVYLVRNGNLNLYIAERMQLLVKLAALGLYIVAAHQFYLTMRTWFDRKTHAPACDCHHELPTTWVRSLLLYGWFFLPLALGFTLPDGLLGSNMAKAKGVQFNPQQAVNPWEKPVKPSNQSTTTPLDYAEKQTEEPSQGDEYDAEALDLIFTSDNFTESYAKFGRELVKQDLIEVTDKRYLETLTTLDLYRSAFIGKTIQISGFVHREEDMADQQFGVSRFAINCCSADASPYGVMVRFGRAETLNTDEWVTITGKLTTTNYNDIDIILIDVEKVVKIPPPAEPYVSPDLDFGME